MQKRFEVISVERNDNVTTVMCNSVVKMFGGFLSKQESRNRNCNKLGWVVKCFKEENTKINVLLLRLFVCWFAGLFAWDWKRKKISPSIAYRSIYQFCFFLFAEAELMYFQNLLFDDMIRSLATTGCWTIFPFVENKASIST